MEKRICNYRNCKKELDETMRKDAKFCCRTCKTHEHTYIKRKEKLILKWKLNEEKKIKMYKYFQKIVKGEYNN